MGPRETENNAYAKFWGDKQRAYIFWSGQFQYCFRRPLKLQVLVKYQTTRVKSSLLDSSASSSKVQVSASSITVLVFRFHLCAQYYSSSSYSFGKKMCPCSFQLSTTTRDICKLPYSLCQQLVAQIPLQPAVQTDGQPTVQQAAHLAVLSGTLSLPSKGPLNWGTLA